MPSALMSRTFGVVSDIEFPPAVQRIINNGFARIVRLNLDEAEKSPEEYRSLNALFTRNLKKDARPIASADVVSPVDGRLSFMGRIDNGELIEVKGQRYGVDKLLGTTSCDDWVKDAFAFIIYLSPTNYHQIHAPVSGRVVQMSYVPGRLLPVNRLGYMLTDDLLPANERLTSIISEKTGHRLALVKVGATCVGKISVVYEPFHTNRTLIRRPLFKSLEPPYNIDAGSKLGCFELGSTVVLLVESACFKPSDRLRVGDRITLGTALGDWK